MKVLWFTNIQLPAVSNYIDSTPVLGGGWMDGLRAALAQHHPDVELHIACLSATPFEPFKEDNAWYYPVVKPSVSDRFARIINNWKHKLNTQEVLSQCQQILKHLQPDIIHVHGTENAFGLLSAYTSTPLVISLQGIIQSCQFFRFSGISSKRALQFLMSKNYFRGTGLFHHSIIERKIAKREQKIFQSCNNFIGRTEWDKNIVMLLAPNANYYHSDEILREPFYQHKWNQDSFSTEVLFSTVSSGLIKGTIPLLQSMGILVRNGHQNLRLKLAGNVKKEETWKLLEKEIRKENLESNVDLLGLLKADQLANELSRDSVFVHPSFIDNSPNSLAEAMMVGIPCVATAVGGVPSMLEHGKEGLLCTPGDPYSIASIINAVLSDEQKAISFSKNSRARALQRHDIKTIVFGIRTIYEEIINNGKR